MVLTPAKHGNKVCGEPGGEKSLQNIRKRVRLQRAKESEAALVSPTLTAANAAAPQGTPSSTTTSATGSSSGGSRKGVPNRGYRLRPDQVAKEKEIDVAKKEAFDAAYCAATTEYARVCGSGRAEVRVRGHRWGCHLTFVTAFLKKNVDFL